MTGGWESQSNICMFGFYKDKAMDSQSNYEIPACLGKTGRVSMELWPGIIISYTVNSHNQADIEGRETEKIFRTKMIQLVITSLVITACQSFVFQDNPGSPGQ